jgi:hypothetical protein
MSGKVAALDARTAVAEAALNAVDKKEASRRPTREGDRWRSEPHSRPSQAFFAVAIEFGSGVGFWLVFGHAGPRQRGRWYRHHNQPSWSQTTRPEAYPRREKPAD